MVILSQVLPDSAVISGTISSSGFFYIIEIIIIICVIIYQIYLFKTLYEKIKQFKNIFRNPLNVENNPIASFNQKLDEDELEEAFDDTQFEMSNNGESPIVTVETSGDNNTIIRIKNAINSYLINNFGAPVNFSIIKDIIDREVDAEDEEISQAVTTPLYLGLAATMIGIIFGLFSMPAGMMGGVNFADGISTLINGVKVAMIASLSGLALTITLSAFYYKNAKKIVIHGKNDQLSYLQSELLPVLEDNVNTGIAGLKDSLDRFAREATKTVQVVNDAVKQTGLNIHAQIELIDKVENLKMMRVTKANYELFDRLEANMGHILKFSDSLETMAKISENLNDFSMRTSNIENVIMQINSNLEESRILTRFLSEHFEKIENAGENAEKAVILADAHFANAIEILSKEVDNRINALRNTANSHEVDLKGIYQEIGEKLSKLSNSIIEDFKKNYINSIPSLKELESLTILPEIKNSIETKGDETNASIDEFRKVNSSSSTIILEKVTILTGLLEKLISEKKSEEFGMVLTKLNELQGQVTKATTKTPTTTPKVKKKKRITDRVLQFLKFEKKKRK